MGRRKIEIKFIGDDRNRSVTFIKRKNGLFKKAHELSILTGAKVTVHVEDIKERQFDYVSANLGGEVSHQNFISDDDDDDANSNDGQEDPQDGELHESASSVGSATAIGSKRDSGMMRPGNRRSQSSIHLSPNPNVPNSRRSSGHPYPRSPNAAPVPAQPSGGLARPASMDFSMSGYNYPAGGPQRKASVPSMPPHHTYPPHNLPQQNQFSPQQSQPGTSSAQFYFQPNQSQPVLSSYDHSQQQFHQQNQQQQPQQQTQQQSQQMREPQQTSQQQQFAPQQIPRYNGNLFQANGYPATNSQRHVPAYPSNLVPNVTRPHSETLPSSKQNGHLYQEFGGTLGEYLDDEMDQDFDALATQASTPGNYDFSTNPSLTNLKMTATPVASQSSRNLGLGIPMPLDSYGMPYLPDSQQAALQYQAAQRHAFYNNMSGAQSTPNLAWLSSAQNNAEQFDD